MTRPKIQIQGGFIMKKRIILFTFLILTALTLTFFMAWRRNFISSVNFSPVPKIISVAFAGTYDYPIVETGQIKFFDSWQETDTPSTGKPFYGQDAHYQGNKQSYTDNGDGTITDNVTGLMWEKGFVRCNFDDAQNFANNATTGGYKDWRVPTIKELYSLIDFTGSQGFGRPEESTPPADAVPFINTGYFDFEYPSAGRYIDVQFISSTEYVGMVMNNQKAFFGVNFADGRIKGYPQMGRPQKFAGTEVEGWHLRLVRGNTSYGKNSYVDNGDGTITDSATGLMWMQCDSGDKEITGLMSGYTYNNGSLNWEEALYFAENIEYAGYKDWRLPSAKELQSIVDYTRTPDATNSAAIDPKFSTTEITNEAGYKDYPGFWTSTSFEPGRDAVVIYFGRALGYMHGQFMDVHGAGAQRTEPKIGELSYGHGPQGDVRRVYNYVRLVRNAY